MTTNSKKTFKKKRSVIYHEVEGIVYVLDEAHDTIVTLNETGSFLWKLLDMPKTLPELVEALTNEYEVEDKDDLQKEVESFLSKISHLGVLV